MFIRYIPNNIMLCLHADEANIATPRATSSCLPDHTIQPQHHFKGNGPAQCDRLNKNLINFTRGQGRVDKSAEIQVEQRPQSRKTESRYRLARPVLPGVKKSLSKSGSLGFWHFLRSDPFKCFRTTMMTEHDNAPLYGWKRFIQNVFNYIYRLIYNKTQESNTYKNLGIIGSAH